jgi:hypothetical protein
MEASDLKGPAFPADFSGDVPEYSDEEMAAEIKKVFAELRAKEPPASASSPPPSSTTSPQK